MLELFICHEWQSFSEHGCSLLKKSVLISPIRVIRVLKYSNAEGVAESLKNKVFPIL
jgi:hypothetical protein